MAYNNLIMDKEKISPVELDKSVYRKLNELKAKNSIYEKFLNNLDIFVYDGPTDENFDWKAAVSSKGEMLLNKKYFINASDKEIEFIIAHELYHVIYGHTKSTPFSWLNTIQTQAKKYNIRLTDEMVNNILLIVTDFFINPILEYDLEYTSTDALYPYNYGIKHATIENMIEQMFKAIQKGKQNKNTQAIIFVESLSASDTNTLDINNPNISPYSNGNDANGQNGTNQGTNQEDGQNGSNLSFAEGAVSDTASQQNDPSGNDANGQNGTNQGTNQEDGQNGSNLSSTEGAVGDAAAQQNDPSGNGNETKTDGSNSNINSGSSSNGNQTGKARRTLPIFDKSVPKCYAGEQTEQLFDTYGQYLEELKKVYGRKNEGGLNSITNDNELKEAVINKLNETIEKISKDKKEEGDKLSDSSVDGSTSNTTSKGKATGSTRPAADAIARLASSELLGRVLNDNVTVQTVEIDLKSLLGQLIRKDFKLSPFSTNVIATETRPNYAMPPIRCNNVVIYQRGYLPVDNRINLGVVIDTSGSMSHTVYPKELGRSITYRDYVLYLFKQLLNNNHSSIDKIYVSFSSDDAKVVKCNNSKELNNVNENIPWGGGTDIPKGIRQLFKELEKNKDKLDLAIVFTDCETDWDNLPDTKDFKKLVKNIYLVKVDESKEPKITNNTVKNFFDKQYWANPDTLKVKKSLEM
jgi:predicted metal-dependent peptidase